MLIAKKKKKTVALSNSGKTASLKMLAGTVRNALNSKGWIVLKNFGARMTPEMQRAAFLRLNQLVGTPIGHDRAGKIIWDIKARQPGKDANAVVTFSEHNHEADLHTDSQYSEYPEDFFSLLTLKRAACGGGESSLLSLKAILAELRSTAEGRRHLAVLRDTDYPFIVPNVFRKHPDGKPEFAFGPILRDNEIRFRIDTIEKALAYAPEFCSAEQLAAFNFLKQLIRSSKATQHFFLENNDLIFIHNKTMLHGRGSFTDPERHLLRIRMVAHGAEQMIAAR